MSLAERSLQGSQRTAAAGWEALHGLMCRGYRLTESGRGADLRVTQAVSISPVRIARRMTAARDSPDERALHLTTESPTPPCRRRGALFGPNVQGFDCIPSNPRSRSRVHVRLRPILEPGNREVEIGLTGRHLTAERSTHPGRKGTRIYPGRRSRRSTFRGGCADTYGSLAQEVGGQGALIRPE